jgi:GT2 family glycosyltransferase
MQFTTTSAAAPAGPAISVVLPTCRRPELLERCLLALIQQSLPGRQYEIIVVDDAPNPGAAGAPAVVERVRRGSATGSAPLLYIQNPGPRGPAAARNRGWRTALAPIVAFTDDDTIPAPHWLACGLAAFVPGVDAVRGRLHMPLPDRPTDYERDAKRLEESEFVTANCFCRKEVLARLDGFDERFTAPWREDSDLHFRLLRASARIASAPDAVVVHPIRPAPWGVSLRQVPKISFDALLYKKHPQLYRERIRATPRWDYYVTVASFLLSLAGLAAGQGALFAWAGLAWLALTAWFCAKRLRGTAKTLPHVAEMVVTSALIPPLAVYCRLAGAVRYRVRFA